MKLGAIIEWTDDLPTFRSLVRLADELGYEVIGIGDSPARAHDMIVSLATAAHECGSATLAATVTTPIIRHPYVTAAAASALYELTGGRAVLGIGNGGSALRVLGRTSGATRQELSEFVSVVRDLLDGRTTQVDGRTTEILHQSCPVPIYIAADHPNTLELAGELANGVIMSVGSSAELVAEKIAIVRAAAEKAGRDPEALDFWGFTFAAVRDSRAAAINDIGPSLAAVAGYRFRARHMRAIVPPELLPALQEMECRYDPLDYVVGGKNALLLEELGLADLAIGLNALIGNMAEVAGHLRRLERLGMSCVLAAVPNHLDPAGTLRRFSHAASAAPHHR